MKNLRTNTQTHKAFCFLTASIATVLATQAAQAATMVWDGATANWNTAHWTGSVAWPGNGNDAVINSGVVTADVAQTIDGTVTLGGGQLKLGTNNALGSATSLILGGGTLTGVDGDNRSLNTAISVTSSTITALNSFSGGNLALNGNITGSGTLTGNATAYSIDLSGDNSGFTGTYNHSGNGATIFSTTTAGSVSAAWSATSGSNKGFYTLASGTYHFGSLSGGTSTTSLGANTGTTSTTYSIGALGTNTTWSGYIADSFGGTNFGITAGPVSVTKVGGGTQTFAGANTYTGITTLSAGTIKLGVAEVAGTSGPLGKSSAANAGSIVLNGGYLQYSTANQNDYSGRFSTAANQQYKVDTDGQNVTWATALTSSGGSLTKTGTGTLTLTGSSTYSGATTISGGTLKLAPGTVFVGSGDGNTVTATAPSSQPASPAARMVDGSAMSNSPVVKTSTNTNTGWSGSWMTHSSDNPSFANGSLFFNFANATSLKEMVIWNLLSEETTAAYGRGMRAVNITYSLGADTSGVGGGTIFTGNLTQATSTGTATQHTIANGWGYTNDFNFTEVQNVKTVKLAWTSNYGGDGTGLSEVLFATTNPNTSNLLPTTTALTVDSPGTLDLGGVSQQVASLAGSGSVINSNESTASTFTLNSTSGSTTFSGAIGGGGTINLVKSGNGTQILGGANTYTGTTTINAGTLSVATIGNGGVAGNLGNATSAAANLVLGGGTLQYTGATASTNRAFTLIDGTTLDASGSGAINFTNAGGLAYGVANQARTLTLAGSNTGLNTLTAAIADNGSGATSLVKSGAGQWVLAGNNSYSGGTTISAGTLVVNGSIQTDVSVASGAFLGGSGTIGDGAYVGRLSGAGTISPGSITGVAGILSAYTFNPSEGLRAAFEFTSATSAGVTPAFNSLNDVLNLTSTAADPFARSGGLTGLTSANAIDIYFNVTSILPADRFSGGMFVNFGAGGSYTDPATLIAGVQNATYTYWVKSAGSGVRTFNGVNYDSFTSNVTVGAIGASLGINSSGYLTEFVVVPEPDTIALAGLGIAMAAWTIWKRRRISQLETGTGTVSAKSGG